jgi:hypothetical protein
MDPQKRTLVKQKNGPPKTDRAKRIPVGLQTEWNRPSYTTRMMNGEIKIRISCNTNVEWNGAYYTTRPMNGENKIRIPVLSINKSVNNYQRN